MLQRHWTRFARFFRPRAKAQSVYGFLAPAATPPEVIQYWNQAIGVHVIHHNKVGDVTVTSLVEYYAPTHVIDSFGGSRAADIEANLSWLAPHYYVPHMKKLVIAITLWLVRANDRIILVDSGYGNDKPRGVPHANMLNTLTMTWLEAAGATRESVTDVITTHLHSDHVGWNTVPKGDGWAPNFPNATYYFPKTDYDYFAAEYAQVPRPRRAAGFGDSVLPLMEAGQGVLFAPGQRLLDMFDVTDAFGHTPGMVSFWFESQSKHGVFCADVFHHPIQIVCPGWNSPADFDENGSRRTRAAFLERAADTQALIMPCHFPPPGCGYIKRKSKGFIYEPVQD